MKILLVTHKFPPYAMGGVEVYTRRLALSLREHHQVGVFFRHDDQDGAGFAEHDRTADGILTRRVSRAPGGISASAAGEFFATFASKPIEASFARFVAQFRPDLIHIQHVMALSARLLHLARESGVPVILTLHDYWYICSNSQLVWPDARPCQGKACGMNCVRCASAARFPSPWVRFLRPALAPLFLYRDHVVKQAALQANQFIAPSRFLLERYAAAGFHFRGAESSGLEGRFHILENGIPCDQIRRFARRPSQGPLRVTYLGALAWQKGVHILVEAFNGLPPGAAQLRIWGDPAVFPAYTEQLRRLLAHPGAQIMGCIPNEEVGEVLADSDVLVVPSLWYENSPTVIQEAWAAAVPVIASGQGALAEKVRNGVDGLLFPTGDVLALRQALQRLVDEPQLLPRLKEGIRPPVDLSCHVQALEQIYYEAIQARAHR